MAFLPNSWTTRRPPQPTESESPPSYSEATRPNYSEMPRVRHHTQSQTAAAAVAPAPRSSSTPTTAHTFSARGLTLDFKSHASSPTSTPVFFTNSTISGTLTWDIPKSESPKEITVTVEGWLERATEATLFVAQAGVKDNASQESVARKPFYRDTFAVFPSGSTSNNLKAGKHAWPFQFRVPKSYKPIEARTFHLEYHRDRTEFDLPPTFIDRGMPYILQFAVVAEVKRGFMKLDNVVRAPFRHVPISIPDFPASNLRQDAYRHGLLLPPPEVDVEGYSTTETRLSGTWSNSPFELRCQLFLPLPHQYTTGSPIHFFLKFTPAPPSASSTSMAKSKSTSPSSGRVSPLALVRSRSRAYSHPPGSPQAEGSKRGGGGDGGSGSQQSMLDPELFDFLTRPSSLHVALARVMTVDGRVKPVANGMEALGVATLWEATSGIPGAGPGPANRGPGTGLERVLQGEIPLRSSLLPDFVFPCLEVGYEIKLKFSSSLQPASSPLHTFPQLPNIVVFASPSAPTTSFPATSPLATASPAYRFTPPLVEFNANLQQRIPVLDTTKVRPALPALPMAAGAPGGSIYSSGSSAAGGSGGPGQAQRGQPALQLMMPPFLSVPVALVNASRLNEPKPRSYAISSTLAPLAESESGPTNLTPHAAGSASGLSLVPTRMGSSSTVRTTDTTTPLLARSTSAARER